MPVPLAKPGPDGPDGPDGIPGPADPPDPEAEPTLAQRLERFKNWLPAGQADAKGLLHEAIAALVAHEASHGPGKCVPVTNEELVLCADPGCPYRQLHYHRPSGEFVRHPMRACQTCNRTDHIQWTTTAPILARCSDHPDAPTYEVTSELPCDECGSTSHPTKSHPHEVNVT